MNESKELSRILSASVATTKKKWEAEMETGNIGIGNIGIGNIGIGNIRTLATFSNCAVTKMDAMFIPSIMQRV